MPRFIIHKDGAYNFYSTVSDGVYFESALTLDQLRRLVKEETGNNGLIELALRLERAHKTGCSGRGETLRGCISTNRAGPSETKMPYDEFVKRYLTLEKPNSP
jgi:hypothetical protein